MPETSSATVSADRAEAVSAVTELSIVVMRELIARDSDSTTIMRVLSSLHTHSIGILGGITRGALAELEGRDGAKFFVGRALNGIVELRSDLTAVLPGVAHHEGEIAERHITAWFNALPDA